MNCLFGGHIRNFRPICGHIPRLWRPTRAAAACGRRARRDEWAHQTETRAIPYDQISAAPPIAPQRARGRALLSVTRRGPSSVIADLHMGGSAKLLFPRPQDTALEAVFLNCAGGITGGDVFSLTTTLAPGAALRMTTQAAERIYRAMPGAPGRVETRLTLASGADMMWLPQETILFDGAALDRTLTVEMAEGARLLACEALVFGRAAMGERVRSLHLRDRIDLRSAGRLVFADRLRLDGDAQAQLDRAAVAGGAGAMASVLLAGPGAAGKLDAVRAWLPDGGGASALSEDLVFARLVAPDSFTLRAALVPLLTELARAALPRPWML